MKRHPFSYTRKRFGELMKECLALLESANHVEVARDRLSRHISRLQQDMRQAPDTGGAYDLIRVKDCAAALRGMLEPRSDVLAGFSVIQALFDQAKGVARPDLEPAFYADLMHIFMGAQGFGPGLDPGLLRIAPGLTGRRAARRRSSQLDQLSERVEERMASYAHGLQPETIARRARRREAILAALGASADRWGDWRWQVRHVVRDAEPLARMAALTDAEHRAVSRARQFRLPFGVTPYYLSLFDEAPGERDRAVRAQVLPPADYVESIVAGRANGHAGCDFMLERDTSPVDLITRRYPNIAIFKPYNTCPQICVYCQRNWEISDVLAEDALAPPGRIRRALDWLRDHPAIREVLITGGDPWTLDDEAFEALLAGVAAIPSVERIRIGTRTPVTMPMRVTDALVAALRRHHDPPRREIAVVTHVEHPYEITPELAAATQRIRGAGIAVYNQLVYTFFVSRRFEAALLRRLLRRIGIDAYYTFSTKGKEETGAYRVPIARILQEAKEEARLLPGLERTDEPVYNVPGLGKNYLRAAQHRNLLAIRPNGARVYEFHSWEKNVAEHKTYVGEDVPILDYLERLRQIGEHPADYETIWYYF